MRNMVFVVVLISMLMGVSGCVDELVAWGSDKSTDIFGRDMALVATLAEIDAVSKLKSDEGRFEGFNTIAGRSGLQVEAQVHLVKKVYGTLYFDNAKVDVLLVLIANPSYSNEAKNEILVRLDKIKDENDKVGVLSAINNRIIGVTVIHDEG